MITREIKNIFTSRFDCLSNTDPVAGDNTNNEEDHSFLTLINSL